MGMHSAKLIMPPKIPDTTPLTENERTEILLHLEKMLGSAAFANSRRASEFLRLIVNHALAGTGDPLRERMIGVELFGRRVDYDTANDAIVRVTATEVRRRLSEYYSDAGLQDRVRVSIPAGGYRPLFVWKHVEGTPGAESERSEPEVMGENPPARHASLVNVTFLLIALCCLSLAIASAFIYTAHRRQASAPITSLAVLPLENISGDRNQEYFADGLTDELIATVGRISALRVVSRTSSSTYKNMHKTIPQIGRELAVGAVIEGTVQRDAKNVLITIKLIDAKTDRQLWSRSYTRGLENLLMLQGDIAQAVSEQVEVQLTPAERTTLSRNVRIASVAQDNYLHGIERIGVGEPQQARGFLQQAIDQDPSYAQAHATLALLYGWMGDAGYLPSSEAFSQEQREALVADRLDSELADSHVALAQVAADVHWDWKTEEAELARALILNSSSTAAHWAYSAHLERSKQFDGAIAEMKRAILLDPVSSHVYTNAALTYYFARHNDAALAEVTLASRFPHRDDELIYPLGATYAAKGLLSQSIDQFEREKQNPYAKGHLGYALALSKRKKEAIVLLNQLQRSELATAVGAYEEGLIYAALGEKSEALRALERAYTHHDKGMVYLAIDPCLDSIRSETRFQDLLRKMAFN